MTKQSEEDEFMEALMKAMTEPIDPIVNEDGTKTLGCFTWKDDE